jgi:hypothetical protein
MELRTVAGCSLGSNTNTKLGRIYDKQIVGDG